MTCARREAGAQRPAPPASPDSAQPVRRAQDGPEPRAGRPRARLFRLLPALALLLAALSPFAAAPAAAQTVWSAQLTVPSTVSATGSLGCHSQATTDGDRCSNTSVLTDDDFTAGATDFTINAVTDGRTTANTDFLTLDVKPAPTAALMALKFCVGSAEHALTSISGEGVVAAVDVGWSAGDKVNLSIGSTCPAGARATVPSAPTGLAVEAGNANLSLSWTAPAGTVTGYDVEYTTAPKTGQGAVGDSVSSRSDNTDASAGWLRVSRGFTSTTAYQEITSLTNGQLYRVRVRAENAGGPGAWVHGTGTPARGAPLLTGLTLSAGGPTLPLSPAFAAGTTSYTATAPHDATTVSVTPTWTETGVTVQRRSVDSSSSDLTASTAVSSSGTAGSVTLASSGVTHVVVTINVTGTANFTAYRITVTKAAAPPAAPAGAVWTALLTAGPVSSSLGCDTTGSHACSNSARLTDNDFSFGGNDYTVRLIGLFSGQFDFWLKAGQSWSGLAGFTLHVDSTSLAAGDGAESSVGAAHTRQWTNTGLSFAQGLKYRVSLVPPPGPRDLEAQPLDTALQVSWEAVSGADAYQVQYTSSTSVADDLETTVSNAANGWKGGLSTTGTSQRISGLTNETAYRVRVRSITDSRVSSAWSFTTAAPAQVSRQAPSVPRMVRVTPGDSKLTLTWLAPSSWGGWNADGYQIQSDIATPGSFRSISSTAFNRRDPTATGFVFQGTHQSLGVSNGTSYKLRIRAIAYKGSGDRDDAGNYRTSAWVTVTGTPQAATTAPGAVTGLTATPGDNRVHLAWTPPPGEVTTYEVHETTSTTVGDNAGTAATVAAGWRPQSYRDDQRTPRFTSISLANGTLYRFRVRAVNSAGNGPWTVVSATPAATSTPVAQWARSAITVKETGADQRLKLDVLLSKPLTGNARVRMGREPDGSTASPEDWDKIPGTGLCAGTTGATSLSCTLVVKGDFLGEDEETLKLVLTVDLGTLVIGARSVLTVTIVDDDIRPPTDLLVTPGDTKLDVSWTAPEGAEFYRVHYTTSTTVTDQTDDANDLSANPANGWVNVLIPNSYRATSTSITGLTNNTEYRVRVRAHRQEGLEKSAWVVAKATPNVPPPRLTGLSLTVAGSTIPISPAFAAGRSAYTATVPSFATSVAVTPTWTETGVTVDANSATPNFQDVITGTTTISTSGGSATVNLASSGATWVSIPIYKTADATNSSNYRIVVTKASPPPAAPSDAIWSAILYATHTGSGQFGCGGTGTSACSTRLTDDDFSHGTPATDYSIGLFHIYDVDDVLIFQLGTGQTWTGLEDLTLTVDSSTFDAVTFEVANGTTSANSPRTRRWAAGGLLFAQDREYRVSLKPPAVGAPTGLSASAADGSLSLSWTAPSGTVDGYIVYYTASSSVGDTASAGTDPATEWVTAAFNVQGTSYTLSGLTNGQEYRVRVLAVSGTDFGAYAFVRGTPNAAVQSSDATLSLLAASTAGSAEGPYTEPGSLAFTPVFAASTTAYTASVAHAVTHLKVTPTANHAQAAVGVRKGTTGDFTAVTSGQASAAIALDEGANAITLRVTAQDETTKDYTLTVTRQAAVEEVTTVIEGGPPPSGALWQATLTVRDGQVVGGQVISRGCGVGSGSNACSRSANLTDDDFDLDGTDYTVTSIILNNDGGLSFKVNASLPLAKRRLVLFVGDRAFTGRAAAFQGGTTPARNTLRWSSTAQSWSTGGEVRLTLVELPTVALRVRPNPVTEGESVTVEASLEKGGAAYYPSSGVQVTVILRDGTSEAADWGERTGGLVRTEREVRRRIAINSGHGISSSLINVPTFRDAGHEDETFTVEIDAARLPAGVVEKRTAAVTTVTIRDPDEPFVPSVVLEAAPNPVPEGGTVGVSVQLQQTRPQAVTVPLVVTRGTSEADDHGTLASITVPAGRCCATAQIATVVDPDLDDETFTVAVDPDNVPEGYRTTEKSAAQVTIEDNGLVWPEVSISAGPGVTEGGNATFTLTADPAPGAALPVTVTLSQGGDIANASALGVRRVTIARGATTASFTVATVDDAVDEADGSVTAALAAATGYRVSETQGSATVAVADDDDARAPSILTQRGMAIEGPNVNMTFTVTLNWASSREVTVDWATADGEGKRSIFNPAEEYVDYLAESGTLTFAPGETSKTFNIGIFDDAIDEGFEYFLVKYSNPVGGRLAAGDREVLGIIRNDDHLQSMWLSRFGRTVGSQVTDAVSGRLEDGLAPGAHATLMGQGMDLSKADDAGALADAMTGLARAFGAPGAPAEEEEDDPFARHGLGDAWNEPATTSVARPVTGRELLLGSSFHVAPERDGAGPGLAVWGRVEHGGFDGEHAADTGTTRVDGTVLTGVLGADAEWNRVLAGVAVSLSEGEGTYDSPGVDVAKSGKIESTMTVVSPYARLHVTERVSAWGLAGWGTGDMTIRFDDGSMAPVRTDLSMQLGAVGARGALLTQGEAGGMDLALKADAFFVRTKSEAARNSAEQEADASRLRLVLEGGRRFALSETATLRPSLELGVRQDGGDAETGAGVELGGGVAWTDAATGLSVEARARMLVAHADSDYEEWGMSATARLDPGERGRGLSFSLSPTIGAASSASERMWGAHDARGLAPGGAFEAARGLQAEAGYGMALFGGRFTGTPNLGFGMSDGGARDYRAGWRLTPAGPASFQVNLDATRREPANDNEAEHGLIFRTLIRW